MQTGAACVYEPEILKLPVSLDVYCLFVPFNCCEILKTAFSG